MGGTMRRFGFNINFRNTPEEILELGRAVLESELYHAIEVTYYENMAGVDVLAYDHAVRQIAQAYRPNVSVHISAFNASEENSVLRSAILHEFRNCCQYTSLLGGHEIVMHSGRLRTSLHVPQVPHSSAYMGGNLQRIWALSVEMLRNCCDIAKEYGIRLYTENLLDGDLTVRCGTLVQFVNEVGRNNLDIVFDIGHCQQTGGNVPDEVLACGKLLRHLHLHDTIGGAQSHLPIGDGEIDYPVFAAALRKIGYQGIYMLELRRCTPENLIRSRERLIQCL